MALALVALDREGPAFNWRDHPNLFILALGPARADPTSVVIAVRGEDSGLSEKAEGHLILCSAQILGEASRPVLVTNDRSWTLQSCVVIDVVLRTELNRFLERALDAKGTSPKELRLRGSLLVAMAAEKTLRLSRQTIDLEANNDISRFERVVAFIDAHLSTSIRTQDLGRVTGLTPARLSRLFLERTTLTPAVYVLRRRVEVGRALVEAGEDSLCDIAFAVGFSSQAHFTAAFKARWGAPPGQFQRQRRGEPAGRTQSKDIPLEA